MNNVHLQHASVLSGRPPPLCTVPPVLLPLLLLLGAQDAGTAKKLAFSREVRTRCITLEGDDFNPGGLLTGGSRGSGGSLLARLAELLDAEAAAERHAAALADAETALEAMRPAAARYKKCAQSQRASARASAGDRGWGGSSSGWWSGQLGRQAVHA